VLARFRAELPHLECIARAQHRRLAPGVMSLEDLVACGREGLLNAARSYDPTVNAEEFGGWADIKIRGAMIDGIRRFAVNRGPWKRMARGELPAPSRWQRDRGDAWLAYAADVAPGPEEAVAHAELLVCMHKAVSRLKGRQRTLVDRHYLRDEPLADTAVSMGVSHSLARRMRGQALARLAIAASTWT
jgi:RNA polymerase sigma factor (sigma-70 family)